MYHLEKEASVLLRRSRIDQQEVVRGAQTPLDRRVVDEVGHMENPGPFEFIIRAAAVESALEQTPKWPPEDMAEAVQMYRECQEQYDRGDLDFIVDGLDLNSVVANAAYFSKTSPDGIFPPRRSWGVVTR